MNKHAQYLLAAVVSVAWMIAVALFLIRAAAPAKPELPQPLVPKRDAPAWCIEPDYPHGDHWYEQCVEPRKPRR